jgi:hypothetical protein
VPTRTTTTASKGKSTKKKPSAASRLVRVQLVSTGPVSACLVDASGAARIPGTTLQQGGSAGPYRSKRFKLLLGNGNARLRVDGKLRDVPDASPVAFRISKGTFKRVDPSTVPDCG